MATALALHLMAEQGKRADTGVAEQLVACHRLDVATSGLTVLARTKEAAERFRSMLGEGAVRKRYRAFVSGKKVEANTSLQHWISDAVFGKPAPRLVAPVDAPVGDSKHQWKEARMTVLSTQSVDAGEEVLLNLETGRTHQVRAQLASLGSPLVNDSLYHDMAGFLWQGACDDEKAERLVQTPSSTEDLPIGLQCSELSFGDLTVKASEPWWRKVSRACFCNHSLA